MENDPVNFDEWWPDFPREPRGDDYFDALERLMRYAAGLSDVKRAALVDGLVEVAWMRHGSVLALIALEQLAGPDARRRVAEAVATLPTVRPPHLLGDYRHQLLRVLARDPSGEHLAAVDSYCQDEIGPGFTSVVWALWPHHEARFARYHARYFAEEPWDAWGHTLVVAAFVGKPRALEMVRDALIGVSPDAWTRLRTSLLAACARTSRVETEHDLREVQRICGLDS